jgi:dTDP-4-amino-4,6-dideoxygalactose transaminase
LGDAGIATAIHYPVPLHLQPAFQQPKLGKGSFPVAEKTSQEVLSLPMYPELKEEALHFIADKIIEFTG